MSAADTFVAILPPEYDVDLSIAYATSDNFTEKTVYRRALCFLHRDAAAKLQRAIALAAVQGLRFKIFDAYRPTEAQEALWAHTPDPDFLADPKRGSPHSRGVAVDLTLVDGSGKELEMGTPFDAFTTKSHHGSLEVSAEAQANRHLLLGIMTAAGWDCYLKEWWHYQLFHSRDYPLISDAESGLGMM